LVRPFPYRVRSSHQPSRRPQRHPESRYRLAGAPREQPLGRWPEGRWLPGRRRLPGGRGDSLGVLLDDRESASGDRRQRRTAQRKPPWEVGRPAATSVPAAVAV